MRSGHLLIGLGAAAVLTATTGAAMAQDLGVPTPGGIGYQEPATESMERLISLSAALHWIAFLITLFVTVLLGWTCWRYSEKRNPVASRFSHNTTVEVAWTLIPVLILVGIAYPSIKYLYYQETVPPSDVTVKAIGASGWWWNYEYEIDGEEVAYSSFMAGGQHSSYEEMEAWMQERRDEGEEVEETPTRALWKLKTTAPMVVPVDSIIRVQVTSEPGGVLHAFAVPAFGVKTDAVPGALHETWFEANKVGTFYGQCSELCGRGHSYMPIEVEVVSKEDFKKRLLEVQEVANGPSETTTKLAAVVPAE